MNTSVSADIGWGVYVGELSGKELDELMERVYSWEEEHYPEFRDRSIFEEVREGFTAAPETEVYVTLRGFGLGSNSYLGFDRLVEPPERLKRVFKEMQEDLKLSVHLPRWHLTALCG